ncbi:protein pasi2 [Lycorma delicatula]|uniref:protein pasi2 n=1 Tax=Lycorma delicatula TaxID=130591 RepID=UPI003F5145F3
MNYGKKSPSMGTPSVYSHVTSRSSANLKSARSVRSIQAPWYKRPILQDAYFINIQRGSMMMGFYSLFLSIFTVITAVFDLYSLALAAPGSTHYGYYFISYQFVYVGNRHVRNVLILFAMFSLIAAVAVFVTTIMLIIALRKEYEHKMLPWLYVFAVFTILRFLGWLFFSIVNDLIFGYNITMCLLWTVFCAINVYGWILVYSLYLELCDLTKLEDLAHLRMGTMASLNASTTHSLAGSRPTTPHSTVSTAPAM